MAENWNFERVLAMVESYKMLQDWSKWLITLELAICTGLWTKLTGTPKPPGVLYVSWFMFLASIIAASIVLVIVSLCVRKFAISGERSMLVLNIFLGIEYLFFLLGLACLGIRLLQIWFGPEG